MSSTYSSLLRIELQANGENTDTWGTKMQAAMVLLEVGIAGRAAVTHSDAANYTLTTANGTTDEARQMILNVGGAISANRNVVCPALSKCYVFTNATTGGFALTLKTSGGTGISVPNGKTAMLMCDGTNVVNAVDYIPSLTLGSPLSNTFTTGDVKLTIKTSPDSGWVLMNDGTIGSAGSIGSTRANADTVDLFTLLWNNTVDANCAVSGGRGVSAAADYAANKTIALPKALGRALATYGTGSGLTARAMAVIAGEETHTLTIAEMPSHALTFNQAVVGSDSSIGVADTGGPYYRGTVLNSQTNSIGGDSAHNTIQPTLFLNVMIKL